MRQGSSRRATQPAGRRVRSDFPASCNAPFECQWNPVGVPVRAILVDDDVRFLAAAGKLLVREGVDVVGFASNGDEALERAERLRPDVALVDIGLQDESGFDVAHRLARLSGGQQPVILISSYA